VKTVPAEWRYSKMLHLLRIGSRCEGNRITNFPTLTGSEECRNRVGVLCWFGDGPRGFSKTIRSKIFRTFIFKSDG